jgi:two-component sensor histidine kinase/putative methionine-R-sulfoxide reductase with GAF domain
MRTSPPAHLTPTSRIETLAGGLDRALRRAYPAGGAQSANGGQPLREAFVRFGLEAVAAGIPLEDAMAVAAGALQELFERTGGHGADPATTIAAGVALGAVSREYMRFQAEADGKVIDLQIPTQVARLRALHLINRAATAGMSIPELLETTVHQVAESTGLDACAVMLYDAATDSLALRAAIGLNPTSVGSLIVSRGIGLTGHAASTGRTIVAPDARSHEAYLEAPSMGDAIYASQVSVPMHVRGSNQLVGVLNVLSIDRRVFDGDEVAFLETVGGELAMGIEAARTHSLTDARLRRKVTELGTLQRVSRTVASSLDLQNVLRLITEAAVELMDAEAAAIFRVPRSSNSSDEPELEIEYRTGQQRQVVHEPQRDDLILQVIASGHAGVTAIDYVDGSNPLFCLPLRSARETWGALCVRLPSDAELTEDELGLLQAFTDSASLAIENAQLYRNAQHSVETASTLLQEMHHRVRNNLQTVAALLSIQIRQEPETPSAEHLREAVSRIQAIAAVHDLLSDERRLSGVTVDAVARLVAEEARSTIIRPGLKVGFTIAPSDIRVPSKQATVLALLTNELVSNAVMHGFRHREQGKITIRAERRGRSATLEVENDGERIPDNFNPSLSRGLGMRIIQRLVSSDLNGEFSLESNETGTVARITFPLLEA